MRRPHVYERSAPRANRGLPAVPVGNPAAARRHVSRLIANAIDEAEFLGLAEVAAALQAALKAAEAPDPQDGDSGRD